MLKVMDSENPPALQTLHPQVGALCYRITAKGRVKVLLVTSRRTRRWIVPKGWTIDGKTDAQAAMIEAWEEAGVRGQALELPIGHFTYDKVLDDASFRPCRVDVFALKVQELADCYPEHADRKRAWMSLSCAAKHVAEPELAKLLKSFTPRGH